MPWLVARGRPSLALAQDLYLYRLWQAGLFLGMLRNVDAVVSGLTATASLSHGKPRRPLLGELRNNPLPREFGGLPPPRELRSMPPPRELRNQKKTDPFRYAMAASEAIKADFFSLRVPRR